VRIYLAGYYNGKASAYSIANDEYSWFLESYHYINTVRHVSAIRKDRRTIFLDSGAFSAFTKGAQIKLEDYARYIHKNKDIIDLAANLDDLHKREQLTWNNQKALEAMGIRALPVFHTREDPGWLKKYIDAGYDYIALGGMVPESKAWLKHWLDDIWGNYLVKSDGTARIKIHGFGLTTFDLMLRYPWFSVDSTSWVLAGRYGLIWYVDERGSPIRLYISDQSPKRKDWDSHFDTLSPVHKKKLTEQIEARGFKVDELRSIYWKRDLFNIATFKTITDKEHDIRFTKPAHSLF
jgi:hypothetical protein